MSATQKRREPAQATVVPFPGRGPGVLRFLPSARLLLLGFGIVAAVALAYLAARTTPLFALRTIEVRGAPPALETRIRAALSPLEGESLLAFRAGDADRRLASIPEVAGAAYDRDFPHTLHVTVHAERPLAVLRRGDGAWLVAASGRVLRPLAHPERSSLPRLWLKATTDVSVGEVLRDPTARQGLFALAPIERLHVGFVRATGGELTLVLRSGVQVRLGDTSRLRLKLAVARRILPQVGLAPSGVTYLDVTVPERPVASASVAISNPQVEG